MKEPRLSFRCDKKWRDLAGFGSAKRFCGDCKQNVYNLSGMTRRQAKAFLEQNEGSSRHVCVHFVARDAMIVHDGDPLGQLNAQRGGAKRMAAAALAIHAALALNVDGYRFDPFEAVQQAIVELEDTVDEKYQRANQESASMGMMY